jgi:hypothetical protein
MNGSDRHILRIWTYIAVVCTACVACRSGTQRNVPATVVPARDEGPLTAVSASARLMRKGVVAIEVDAGKKTDTFSRVWQGVNASASVTPGTKFQAVRLDSGRVLTKTFPAQGQYAWAGIDRILGRLDRDDRTTVLSMSHVPEWLMPAAGGGQGALPRNLNAWTDMVHDTVHHLSVEREFDLRAIEIWDAPDDPARWRGSMDQYLDLYEMSARAVKRANPAMNVGGPAIGAWRPDWIEKFVSYAARRNVPTDFVSWRTHARRPSEYGEQAVEVRRMARAAGLWPAPPLVLDEWGHPDVAGTRDGAFAASYAAASFREMEDAAYAYAFRADTGSAGPTWTDVSAMMMDHFAENRFDARTSGEAEGIGVMAGEGRTPGEIVVVVWWWLDDDPGAAATAATRILIKGLDTAGLYGWEMYEAGADRFGPGLVHISEGGVPDGADTFELHVGLSLYGVQMIRLVPEEKVTAGSPAVKLKPTEGTGG